MATVANGARIAHPQVTRKRDPHDVDDLLPLAAQLVGCVHDHDPAASQQILDAVPAERLPQLAVILAAMVDPSRSVRELLAWCEQPLAVRSLDDTDWDVHPETWNTRRVACPEGCGELVLNRHMSRHLRRRHPDADQVA